MTLRALTRLKSNLDTAEEDQETLASLVRGVVERQEEMAEEVQAVEVAAEAQADAVQKIEVHVWLGSLPFTIINNLYILENTKHFFFLLLSMSTLRSDFHFICSR